MRKIFLHSLNLVEKLQLVTVLLSIENGIEIFYVEGFSNFSISIFREASLENDKIFVGNFNIVCLRIFVDRGRLIRGCVLVSSGFISNVCFADVSVF